MTHHNAIKFIKNAPSSIPSDSSALKRTEMLFEALGNPQKRIKYIRLAGTNGKTILARMLISVLNKAGIVNGCLSMPLYDEVRDNVRINGEPISIAEITSYAEKVNQAVLRINKTLEEDQPPFVPTTHEIMLSLALLFFSEKRCGVCILESDHNEDDPSRFLPPPLAAIICGRIPSDDSLEIAKIRSFVARGTREIISIPQDQEAYKIISDTCYSVNCRLTLPSKLKFEIKRLSLHGTDFSYKDNDYSLRLCGRFQTENALAAIESAEMLVRCGYEITTQNLQEGLAAVSAPCKFEVLALSPTIIADSTHSAVAINAVCESLADFKDTTGTRVRLCLPEGELIPQFTEALSAHGYTVEGVCSLPWTDHSDTEHTVPTALNKGVKLTVKDALKDLDGDSILLISGPINFTKAIRYELLATLGF